MKKCFMLFAMSLCSLVTFAQGFDYGVTAGLNISKPKDYKNHYGFNLGAKGEYLFSDNMNTFYMESALLFSDKGWEDDVYIDASENNKFATYRYDTYYLEVPLMAGYKFGVSDKVCASVSAGPYAGIKLFENSDWGDFEYKTFDYGLKVYVGADFSHWQIGVSYNHSMQDPIKHFALTNPKDRTLSLQVSYIINRF